MRRSDARRRDRRAGLHDRRRRHRARPRRRAVADLDRLEHDLGVAPGRPTTSRATHTVRIYNLLVHGAAVRAGAGAPGRPADRRGRARPGLPGLVAVVDRHRPGRDRPADPRRRPAHPASPSRTRRSSATRCGRSPTSPRRTAPPASSPAPTCADHSPDYGQPYDSIPAEMAKGSVLVWHGSLWHGGGANRTDERRVGLAMNYCAGYIRQQENQQLGIPRDDRRAASRPGCASSSATASTTASSATSTSATRSSCSTATVDAHRWSGTRVTRRRRPGGPFGSVSIKVERRSAAVERGWHDRTGQPT